MLTGLHGVLAARILNPMLAQDLFTLSDTFPFRQCFKAEAAPWEWLPCIREALQAFDFADAPHADIPPGVTLSGDVFIHPTTRLPPYCFIQGPAWIGPENEIRPGAYIRGQVITGRGCLLGNASEYKNCLLLDEVQTPHYNYVGDSILGNKAHLGAGVICANLRLDQEAVRVLTPDGLVDTGLRKLGAILGDAAEAGCNAVLQPGAILARRAIVGPGVSFSGYLEEGTMAFSRQDIRRIPRPA